MRSLDELIALIGQDPIKFYKTKEWRDVRTQVLKRDHYECLRCHGKWKSPYPLKNLRPGKARFVHHVQSLKDYPKRCIDPDNLVSLCFDCHEVVERRGFSKEKKIPLTPERW